MPVIDLDRVEYILDLYSEASEGLEAFRSSGEAKALSAAAFALCSGLGRLDD